MIWRKGWIAPGWFEEKDELHKDNIKKKVNCTRMIGRKGWIAPG